MFGHLLGGTVQPDGKEIVDDAWVTRESLRDYLDEKNLYLAVQDVLAD